MMHTFEIMSHKCKANSEALVMHIVRMLTCVLRHMQGILSLIEGRIQ